MVLPLQGMAAATMFMQPASYMAAQADAAEANHHCHEDMTHQEITSLQTEAPVKAGKTDSGKTCHTCPVCCTALATLPEFVPGVGLIQAHAIYASPSKQPVLFLTGVPERPPRFVFSA